MGSFRATTNPKQGFGGPESCLFVHVNFESRRPGMVASSATGGWCSIAFILRASRLWRPQPGDLPVPQAQKVIRALPTVKAPTRVCS